MADSSKSNPNGTLGSNEYAGFVAPSRPDQSTIGPGGNRVNTNDIPKTQGGSGSRTQPKPLGSPQSRGY